MLEKDLEKICTTLTNDFESLMEKWEKPGKMGDIAYIVKANDLKCRRSEKKRGNKKVGRNIGMFGIKEKNI